MTFIFQAQRTNSSPILVSLLCALLFFSVLASACWEVTAVHAESNQLARAHEELEWVEGHYFPKFPSTDRVYAIHVRSAIEEWWGDRSSSRSSWRIKHSYDTMMALTLVGLQGVINRYGPAVYLDWEDRGHNYDVSRFWLNRLRDHVEVVDLGLEGLDAVNFLLGQYGALFEGVVIYDPEIPDTINLATMLAGLEDRIIVAPDQVSILDLSSFNNVTDLRILVDEQGWNVSEEGKHRLYEWVYDNLWPRLEHRIIGVISPGPPTSREVPEAGDTHDHYPLGLAARDYIVALRLSALWLSPVDEPQASLFSKFLDDAPSPIPVFGFFAGNEIGTVKLVSEHGDWVPVITNGNAPLSCGSLTVLSGIRPLMEPYLAEINTDRIFATLGDTPVITIFGSDGDSIQVNMDVGYRAELALWDALGGWDDHLYSRSINPTLRDLAPIIWNFYVRDQIVECDLVCGVSGVGYIYPQFMNESQLRAYLEYAARYMNDSGLRTIYVDDRHGSWDDEMSAAYYEVLHDSLLGVQVEGRGGRWKLGFSYSGTPIPAVSMSYMVNDEGTNRAWIIDDILARKPGEVFIDLAAPMRSYSFYPWRHGKIIEDENAYDGKTILFPKEDLADLVDLVWGPFVDLEPGNYTVVFRLKVDDNKSNDPLVKLWVGGKSSDRDQFETYTNRVITTDDFNRSGEYQNFTLSFNLDTLKTGVEFGILSSRARAASADLYADYFFAVREGGSEFPILASVGFSAWFEKWAVLLAEEFLASGGIVLHPDEFMAALNPEFMLEWATEILRDDNPELSLARQQLTDGDYLNSLITTRKALLNLPNRTYHLEILEEGQLYIVTIQGNTWIKPLEYHAKNYTISFDTHGPPQGTIYASIAIPNELQEGATFIKLDHQSHPSTSIKNASHSIYALEFDQGPHTVEVTLPINKPPTASFSYTPSEPTTLDTVHFQDQSSDPEGSVLQYHWDFGDGSTSTQRDPAHRFSTPSTKSVSLTVTDEKGATNSVTRNIMVVLPAEFELSSLNIEPDSLEVGETVTISVECVNMGGQSGSHDITLKIDGEAVDDETVVLNPGESETVSFDVTAAQHGTFSVEVDDLTGSYSVTQPAEKEKKTPRGIPGFPYESIILGLVLGAIILWMMRRRQ